MDRRCRDRMSPRGRCVELQGRSTSLHRSPPPQRHVRSQEVAHVRSYLPGVMLPPRGGAPSLRDSTLLPACSSASSATASAEGTAVASTEGIATAGPGSVLRSQTWGGRRPYGHRRDTCMQRTDFYSLIFASVHAVLLWATRSGVTSSTAHK